MVQKVFRGNLWSESKQKCCVLSAITWVRMFRYMLFSYMQASVVIVVNLLSHVWPSVTLWTVAYQTPLCFIVSCSLPKLMSVESVMPASHLVLSVCLLLCTRWPKYWNFSISPSSEYSGLISLRIDWFDLLAIQGSLQSLLQHHNLKASIVSWLRYLLIK